MRRARNRNFELVAILQKKRTAKKRNSQLTNPSRLPNGEVLNCDKSMLHDSMWKGENSPAECENRQSATERGAREVLPLPFARPCRLPCLVLATLIDYVRAEKRAACSDTERRFVWDRVAGGGCAAHTTMHVI